MTTSKKTFLSGHRTTLSIFLFFLFTTVMQAVPAFNDMEHLTKTGIFFFVLFDYITLCYFTLRRRNTNTEDKVFLIILGGILLRSFYVLFTGVTDRQHDEGYFSGLSDDLINPGHLGYIEYLCKFGHLPDFSPYQLFSYYHPPVHHIISCLFIDLQLFLRVPERLAFENIQALTFLYSALCLPVAHKILKKIGCGDSCMILAMALLTFHPGMIYMSGSVNNDMLCTLLTFTCFYCSLKWMEEKTLKNLVLIALSLGFGMITKLNCAIMAFPLAAVFLLHFVKECKNGRALKSIREFSVFGVLTVSIGLSWVIRNLVFYDTNPGVPVVTEESILYLGDQSKLYTYLFQPQLHLDYPFHNLNGEQICNIWQILFRSSLFDEIRPDLSDMLLVCCQVALILAMTLGTIFFFVTILMQIREIKTGNRELGLFLLTGYVMVVLTFILFVVKYPFTCSANYRYVVIGLLFTGISMMQLSDRGRMHTTAHRIFASIMEYAMFFFVVLITLILLFWNQW